MVEKITKQITKWLIRNHSITEADVELYEYAVFNLIMKILPFLIIIPFCIITGTIINGCILVCVFLSIRTFSGGYHAKTALRCFISSSVIVVTLILCSDYIRNQTSIGWCMLAAFVTLSCFSPIDSENRRLELMEKKVYKIKCMIIVLCYVGSYFVLSMLKQNEYAVCVALGVILAAILQMIAIFVDCSSKLSKNVV